jgi:hypothetical protein
VNKTDLRCEQAPSPTWRLIQNSITWVCAAAICPAIYLTLTARADDGPKQLILEIRDYLTMPDPGKLEFRTQNNSSFARINTLREEPGADRNRLFIADLNGPLYILDKKSKQLATYLDFNGKAGRKGLFHRFSFETGFASGLISFQFDPDYRHNGRFYTIHMEDQSVQESAVPDNSSFPAFNVKGYEVTSAVVTPGAPNREAIVVEWTDTNTSNTTFEGTAREVMRVQQGRIHPMGDLIFNPAARPGDPDWRVLYISCGDGQSGESKNPALRNIPQRLDNLAGKILRIVPDLSEHKDTSTVSDNGRYRIPRDNPFIAKPGARPEIWAYGLRNPHRMNWDVDPADRGKNYLFADVIGLFTWETVVLVRKGANYGYSEREGNQQLLAATNRTGPLPQDDRIPVRTGDEPGAEMVTPTYPVIQYGHIAEGGDAIANGFVYRGKIAALRGKYIFGDITTGHLWWADLKEMIAADDGNPMTMASIHPIKLRWQSAVGKQELYPSMSPIVSAAYHVRGGEAPGLPGLGAQVSGGRADIRLAMDGKGELFIMSKSDGMIREVVNAADH